MDIPDDVKQKARAAFDREMADYMRAFGFTDATLFSAPVLREREARPMQPLSEAAKRQAMDAINAPEIRSQIVLMRETGPLYPPATPSPQSTRSAALVAELQRCGLSADSIQHHLTRDRIP